MDAQEIQRCMESFAYFYNHYCLINGQRPQRQVSDEEVRAFLLLADNPFLQKCRRPDLIIDKLLNDGNINNPTSKGSLLETAVG